jgi:hypothetical protein
MLGWDTVLIQEARSRGLLRQADRERLVRQALADQARSYSFYCRALAWGWRLQERYGAAVAGSRLQPARGVR